MRAQLAVFAEGELTVSSGAGVGGRVRLEVPREMRGSEEGSAAAGLRAGMVARVGVRQQMPMQVLGAVIGLAAAVVRADVEAQSGVSGDVTIQLPHFAVRLVAARMSAGKRTGGARRRRGRWRGRQRKARQPRMRRPWRRCQCRQRATAAPAGRPSRAQSVASRKENSDGGRQRLTRGDDGRSAVRGGGRCRQQVDTQQADAVQFHRARHRQRPDASVTKPAAPELTSTRQCLAVSARPLPSAGTDSSCSSRHCQLILVLPVIAASQTVAE